MNLNRYRTIVYAIGLSIIGTGSLLPMSAAYGEDKNINTVEFSDARLKIEVDPVEGDVGIQVFAEADNWTRLSVYDPQGHLVFKSSQKGRFAQLGGAAISLENAEPSFTEMPLSEFLAQYPAGEYQFRAKGKDGVRFLSTVMLTHNIPDAPRVISPTEHEGELDPANVVLMWEPPEANGSPIIGYKIVLVQDESDFDSLPEVTLDVILPADVTQMRVPETFLLPGGDYEWEVFAIEESGNQTMSSGFFTTSP